MSCPHFPPQKFDAGAATVINTVPYADQFVGYHDDLLLQNILSVDLFLNLIKLNCEEPVWSSCEILIKNMI